VGKTRLVRAVLDSASAELDAGVHWGTCVQFGASTVPFAPMLRALRNVLPPATDSSASVRMLPIIDATVNELAARGLTVLVVDDLQWADVSSLDVLAYLVAGFTHQRLAVVATCRDENRPEGHPLHGWLADMRRMPGFFEIALGRFDLEQTAELLAELHGGGPDLELAALVRALGRQPVPDRAAGPRDRAGCTRDPSQHTRPAAGCPDGDLAPSRPGVSRAVTDPGGRRPPGRPSRAHRGRRGARHRCRDGGPSARRVHGPRDRRGRPGRPMVVPAPVAGRRAVRPDPSGGGRQVARGLRGCPCAPVGQRAVRPRRAPGAGRQPRRGLRMVVGGRLGRIRGPRLGRGGAAPDACVPAVAPGRRRPSRLGRGPGRPCCTGRHMRAG
jgi:AAA ATPase-like protein